METILLKAENLCREFAQGGETLRVLDHVDLEIAQGDYAVIMGPSGAGKSTLLYALSGMDSVTGGRVFYRDKELGKLKEPEMAKLRAKEFGFVFQQTHLVSNLTLFENVTVAGFAAKKRSEKEIVVRAEELLDQMGVENAKDRLPSQTSGGEAQRAALARAVIGEPGIVFADEPTGALNKTHSDEVLELLTVLNRQGQTILMVTHDLRAALRGNRIFYLEDGKVLDELALSPYASEDVRKREETVSKWLSSLRW